MPFVFEFHARITFSSSCLRDMTKLHDWNPWSQSVVAGEVGHAVLECRTACAGVVEIRLHTLPSHPTLAELWGFSWGRLTKHAREVRKESPLYSCFAASAYYTCPITDFTCDTGKCITKRWQCDFDNDCGNMEDERNCSEYAFEWLDWFSLSLFLSLSPCLRSHVCFGGVSVGQQNSQCVWSSSACGEMVDCWLHPMAEPLETRLAMLLRC